jgi:hemolysin activation/secretion protein
MKKVSAVIAACVFIAANSTNGVNAQVSDIGSRGNIQREQIIQQEIEEKLISPVKPEQEKKEAYEIDSDVKNEDAAAAMPSGLSFVLEKIEFKGNTVMPAAELQKLAAKLYGTEVKFDDIKNLVISVSRKYQQEGYLTSYASLPMQLINKGVVIVNINESKINPLTVTGEKWARPWYVNKILFNRKGLREGDVFDASALQAVLKEINNDWDYIKALVALRRNKNDSTGLTIEILDRFPIELDLNFDNYGKDNSGRPQITSILGSQNLTGLGDKIYAGTMFSEHSWGALAGYGIPITYYGTRLNYDFSYTDASIAGAGNIQELGIKGYSTQHSISVSHPFIRSADTDVLVRAGLDIIDTNSTSDLFNFTLSDYKLRVARANASFINDGATGRWILNGAAGVGINGLGATKGVDAGYEESFVKFNLFAARVQRFPVLDSIGVLRISGQYSPNKLYPVEQMQIGGPFSLRGYQPGELLGDTGISGTFEIRLPIPGLKKLSQRKWFSNIYELIKIAPFYDFGDVGSNLEDYKYAKNYLHSAGISIYAYPWKWVQLSAGAGFPLGNRVYGEDSVRFYFGITTEFDKLLTPKKR